MAISSATCRNTYTGDGSTVAFAYSFKITDQSHIKVMTRLIASPYTESTKTITTDYTVSGVGDSAGGNVTFVTAPASTVKVYLLLQRPVTQPTSIRNQGSYFPGTHEDALDHLARVNMQQQDQLNRSIRQPETEAPLDMEIPCAEERASKFLAFDASGLPIASDGGIDDSLPVSTYVETLLDDTTAGAWNATVQAALTEETAPVIGDYIEFNDVSAAAGRKATFSNVLKVIAGLTEDAAPATADSIPTYDASASGPKRVLIPTLVASALEARGFYNLGLANATTTNTNDSIKIQGAAATLSATNPMYINLPTVSSPGRVTSFAVTSDVTIRLDTAHWALGTLGNFTDIILRVYAINDSGTLKWGVSNKGGYRSIADTSTSTTATSITTQTGMLVNTSLTSGTWPCREVGWFLGDFNDTGDLWTVQTGAGEIMVGVPAPDRTDWAAATVTGSWSANTTYVAKSRRIGDGEEYNVEIQLAGAPTTASLTVNLPTGRTIDTSKLNSTDAQQVLGQLAMLDTGTQNYTISKVFYSSVTAVAAAYNASATDSQAVTQAAPFTFASGDRVYLRFAVPLRGFSAN